MFLETKREGEATPDLGTLRVDRILALAEEIENPTLGLQFDMGEWNSGGEDWDADEYMPADCGTACCIGGHAQLMFTTSRSFLEVGGGQKASDALGLTTKTADALFFPWEVVEPWSEITRSRAARVLRHLAATGKVDWNIA